MWVLGYLSEERVLRGVGEEGEAENEGRKQIRRQGFQLFKCLWDDSMAQAGRKGASSAEFNYPTFSRHLLYLRRSHYNSCTEDREEGEVVEPRLTGRARMPKRQEDGICAV